MLHACEPTILSASGVVSQSHTRQLIHAEFHLGPITVRGQGAGEAWRY